MSEVRVIHGDCREVLKSLADASIDSVVCDPPYALVSITKRFGSDDAAACKVGATGAYARASAGFMGKRWDTGETAFDPAFWVEVRRVLKPGGHMIAFGGTRTYHRLACAVEDAGFEIRDQIAWLYGSGFPKSHDVSKGIDKAAGVERQLTGEVRRASIERNGSGRAWEAGAFASHPEENKRVAITAPATAAARQWEGWGTALKPALEPIVLARKPLEGTVAANVLRHGVGALNIDGCRIATAENLNGGAYGGGGRSGLAGDERIGAAAGMFQPGKTADGEYFQPVGRWPANVIHDGSDEVVDAFPQTGPTPGSYHTTDRGDCNRTVYGGGFAGTYRNGHAGPSGSAARFFYSAKADASDRLGSKHPTVKPVDLMVYLCRLVTPPGGTVLDPFAGSGTTGMACLREGFNAVLVEREAEYVADIHHRLKHVSGEDGPLFAPSAA